MARKDVRLMHEAAAANPLRVTAQVAALQDEALARGEGTWDTAAAFRFPAR
jgi:3-hydroxyisobutyrate dehydrogenase-like beta-hydroxyacid dehydrogenase